MGHWKRIAVWWVALASVGAMAAQSADHGVVPGDEAVLADAPVPQGLSEPAAPTEGEPVSPADSMGVSAPLAPVLGAIPEDPASHALLKSGLASWYGPGFHGRRTASGELYNMHELTAAHRYLPFGTVLQVRSVHTGKSVTVRVNDRGPFKHQRILDLSRAAMDALGVLGRGVTQVEVWVQKHQLGAFQAATDRFLQRQKVDARKPVTGEPGTPAGGLRR